MSNEAKEATGKPNDAGTKLVELLKFDPAKTPNITSDALDAIVAELNEERFRKAKEIAKETISKAMELRGKMVQARKAFEKQEGQFEKELGKLMNGLKSALSGQPVAEDDSEAKP